MFCRINIIFLKCFDIFSLFLNYVNILFHVLVAFHEVSCFNNLQIFFIFVINILFLTHGVVID